LSYKRRDLLLVARREHGRLALTAPRFSLTILDVGGSVLDQWVALAQRRRPPPREAEKLGLLVHLWLATRAPDDVSDLFRIVMDVEEDLAGLPWEAMITGAARFAGQDYVSGEAGVRAMVSPMVVRRSMVWPGAAELTITTPLYFMQLGGDTVDLEVLVRDLLPTLSLSPIVVVHPDTRTMTVPSSTRFDLLHTTFPLPPTLVGGVPERSQLGTCERLLSQHRTRLLVLETAAADDESARLFAHRLAARGGPAIVVVPETAKPDAVRTMYEGIIDDRPIDWAVWSSGVGGTTMGGRGREELLRVSAMVPALSELRDLMVSAPHVLAAAASGSAGELHWVEAGSQLGEQLLDHGEQFAFEDKSRSGLITLSQAIEGLRANLAFPANVRPAVVRGERFLNVGLSQLADTRQVPVESPCLAGTPVDVTVDVGPQEKFLLPLGAVPILDQVLYKGLEEEGRWVEVAVSGIDVDIVGDPVRWLWVSRNRASARVSFTVMPKRPGASALRVSLYADQHLVQAIKLAMRVTDRVEGWPADTALAERLGSDVEEVAGYAWRTRLEFGTTLGNLADVPARALSIIANSADDQSVIAVKGENLFKVQTTSDLSEKVEEVRQTLDEISVRPVAMAERTDWPYAFDGDGDEDVLLERSLVRLARVGYELFNMVIDGPDQQDVEALLRTDGSRIHVAHILLEHVIPWSVVYDRHIDTGTDESNVKACLAGLPDARGAFPQECGTARECPLSRGENPDRVACPRHFWGFRHVVEIPARQLDKGAVPRNAVRTVHTSGELLAVIGHHAGLRLAANHVKDVVAIRSPRRSIRVLGQTCSRDKVIEFTKNADLQIVYFFCHADKVPGHEARLRFMEINQPEEVAKAPDFGVETFSNSPLVVLNGCRTAGFRPDALSSFIRQFVGYRWAGAFLGTEIRVFEPLAAEVGLQFLTRMLEGERAGDALGAVRRDLLRRKNPLGLVYTLYADADFQFV
jgi:hypothetical protein